MTRCRDFYVKHKKDPSFCKTSVLCTVNTHIELMDEYFPDWLKDDKAFERVLLSERTTRIFRSLRKTDPDLFEIILNRTMELDPKERTSSNLRAIILEVKEWSWEVPYQLRLFNTWNFSEPLHGSSGYKWGYNTGHITENLLYYYTRPKDLVIDPMAGSGTTIDACKRMKRKCNAFDKYPSRKSIIKNDIHEGIPVKEESAQFVFLDPPFYNLLHNEFSLSYEDFEVFVKSVIDESIKVLRVDGYLALIMLNLSEVQEDPKRAMIGDCYEWLKTRKELRFENMILCPLSTQRSGTHIAKENKDLLNNNRVVWVFKRVA